MEDDRKVTPRPPTPPRAMRAGVKQGETGINRLLARLRHLCSWAIVEGYATETPFRRHGVTVIKLEMKAETARTRRLEPGEEDALRLHAMPHMRALIIAALSTGCRLGELLSLRWAQIRKDEKGTSKWIVLDADRTKTNRSRTIPVGPRLRAELEMRKTDPAGKEFWPDAHVFGNEIGDEIASIKTAWRATCRRANIRGLHFHDLRREFGSRLLESGADPHDVREFLGHANITTTSSDLASTPLRLERALSRMEAEPPLNPEMSVSPGASSETGASQLADDRNTPCGMWISVATSLGLLLGAEILATVERRGNRARVRSA